MSEIEKLYEKCMIKPMYWCSYQDIRCPVEDVGKFNPACAKTEVTVVCDARNPFAQLPKFAPEKQLELIKWLIQNKRLCIHKAEYSDNFYMDTLATRLDGVDNSSFEECLASMLNLIWQDLTEEEKEHIRRILNE